MIPLDLDVKTVHYVSLLLVFNFFFRFLDKKKIYKIEMLKQE